VSHRFRVLDELEQELARAVTAGPAQRRTGRARRLWAAVPAVITLLITATIALAATGVILTGSPVPAPAHRSAVSGAGLPLPGRSRLLPLRVEDPEGGLPWGMRVVQTTRGLVCVQIGRVQNGMLGELGIDGAYHDDGRFHPVGPGVLPTYAGGATEGGVTSERGSCVLADGDVTGEGEAWGSAVAAEFNSVSQNAAFSLGRRLAPPRDARNISYGILGPHAVAVSYREGGSIRTEPVVPGVGAYLIVQRATGRPAPEGHGEAPGTDTPGQGPGTTGVLTTITYEDHGHICENGYDARTGATDATEHACPPPPAYPADLRVTPPGSFVRTPAVTLRVEHGTVTAAEVSFSAPFAVTSAAEGYTVWDRTCNRAQGGGVAPLGLAVLDRNVAAGATVNLTVADPFAARCAGSPATFELLYLSSGPDAKRSYGRAPGELLIGTALVRLPAGERAAAPARRRPAR